MCHRPGTPFRLVSLDDYDRDERDKRVAANLQAVEAVIRDIAARRSADVFLLADADDVGKASRWLALTASSGRYACALRWPKAVLGSTQVGPRRRPASSNRALD